ncbi:MAG: hemolysin family protein [Acidimicrobiales bacterium]|nr:hemolysin family protein [Actinomycetota bacterium]MDA8185076.1 hemolysin family protein [Actinomycetota bacterium]
MILRAGSPGAPPARGALLLAVSGRLGPGDWLLAALVVVMLVAAAVLALAETSLVKTSKARALSLEDEGRRGARQLVELVEHPDQFLSAVLLVVLVCQLVSATLIGVLAERIFGALGVALAALAEVIVIFVLAEAIPKNWAVRNPDRSALFAAPLVSAVVRFPLVKWISAGLLALANLMLGSGGAGDAGAGVTESELLALADVAMEEKVIATEERALIHSIIEFGDTVVREVMVPRPDMRAIDAGLRVSKALEVAMEAGYSRLPVHKGNLDDIVGIAYAKDLFRAEHEGHGDDPVVDHVRGARFVPETKRVASLMREMQDQKFHLAVVVDEYGGTAGLVALEDLIEELVGEIVDEFDVEEPPVVRLRGGELSVSARLGVGELSEAMGTELPEGRWDTVGGLVFDVLGHVPVEGESIVVDGLRLTAERVQGSRIGRVRVTPAPLPGQ